MNFEFKEGVGMSTATWAEPANTAEAEARMKALMDSIRDIEVQLGDRDHRDACGERMEGRDYWQWRRNANFARTRKVAEYGYLKAWLKNQRIAVHDRIIARVGAEEPLVLLNGLSMMVHRWAAAGLVHPSEDEQAVIYAADRAVGR